jgi:endonuclease YncB( thermonuclease family)
MSLVDVTDDKVPFFSLKGLCCKCKVVNIHDGDTVRIVIQYPQETTSTTFAKFTCRMTGYDSPELASHSTDAYKATNVLARYCLSENIFLDMNRHYSKTEFTQIFLQNKKILDVQFHGEDKYGRQLVTLYEEGNKCINHELMAYSFNLPYDGKGARPIHDTL